ncbi:hypothetical protein N1851_017361 [Merluccius polli]|uniref:Uncharacterized protein n=1 Tax=Merluccius polli TaxID=89951 RepID=A0AA47P0U5_MERPO|nr:hypothetical protein N1851_017361 [Merluccius polli]
MQDAEDFTDDDDEDESEEEQTTDDKAEVDCPRELNERKGKTRRPWTKAEENAVLRHFRSHIIKGHLASKRECLVCKECEQPALENRTCQNIRDFVRNKGLTFKRQNSHPH